MKKLLALLMMSVVALSGCQRVEPNEAGVLMTNFGKQGKEDFTVTSGVVLTAMPGTRLYKAPLWEQRGTLEQSVTLKAADNTDFGALPIYSFRINKDRAVDVVFDNKQIAGNSDFIVALQDNILEPKIIDLLREQSRKHTTQELMAEGGSLKFEEEVHQVIAKEFERRGLELISFSSQLTFSKSVTATIDKRNEVNQNLNVLDQKIEEQKKRLELAKLEAETNKAISEGLTDQLLRQQFIEKWDGKTPLYGVSPMLTKPAQ